MKIYLFLPTKIMSFSLPMDIVGSFSFDENPKEENKLINIEARNNKWMIYSTGNVNLISNNNIIGYTELKSDSFYIIRRGSTDYLIYVTDLYFNSIEAYEYNTNIDLLIGNNNTSNIQYPCPLLNDLKITIKNIDNNLLLEKTNNSNGVYINNKALTKDKYYIRMGDNINIYGLKIMFLKGLLLINNPGRKLIILPSAKLNKYTLPIQEKRNLEIEDINLYNKNDYFSKSPRIRRIIEEKEFKISPPPTKEKNEELPIILTIGPMMTMGVSSSVMLIDVINKINTGQTTFKDSWTSVISSSAMLVSMLLWPVVTNIYNKKLKIRKRQELIEKYNKYLSEKEKELSLETKLQKSILIENLITIKECINIIETKNMNLWSKRIDQNDFLEVRIGTGNTPLKLKIEYQEEDFAVEDDELKTKAENIIEKYKYISDVPISYSFYTNIVTAIMSTNKDKSINFMNNILLQLLTFYSYEDLKIVIFTNESKKSDWEYLKYLNHNFNNEKNFRFFASTIESSKSLADYLNIELSSRKPEENKEATQKKQYKPHYLIIIDDYERVKRFDFIKDITETDTNLGFSIIILEDRLSKLPSKCNNFISIGTEESGILQNSYEKQEQITFKDEIDYNINMMNISKILSNIPIEFEEGIKALPDAISFLEMEHVGKVEQLNILNRWKSNDSTATLKSEIGVDNQGDLMYLDLHEKFHGPHGLIAGTTGSGKSEFIITYILSMCINYSPDDIAFILIDYKGGGLALAFENKTTGVSLPHLAGTITNLDKAEMDRTLVSIDSEVKRRQKMFNEARDKLGESTIDIYKYQRHYHDGELAEPIPHLFIICDEFAELKSQQPDFMDNLISVARIGRSLGVHLILATQKPSGVVNDQIWSNTKFRVCLKVQDESDSKEMLKRPEAAHIKQAGRFYLQVGYDEIFELGQSGWCGAKYYPSDKIVKQVDKSVNIIDDCGNFIKSAQEINEIKIEAQGEQLAAIMKNIIEISNKINKRTRRLWLDNIPAIILVDNLEKKYNLNPNKYILEAIIGEYDAPEKQEQGQVVYNYLEDGNTIIYGTNSSENEMLLSTLIYSTTKNHTAEEINYYIIDYGSESLRIYANLPQIGGMVFTDETEKYNNLIKLLREEMTNRKKLFINYGGEYNNFIKNSNQKLPIITVIINNFDSFYEANQNAYDDIPDLVRDSSRYGIIYIFTGTATNSVPTRISQNFPNIYAYKLKDLSDYPYLFNVKSKTVPRDIEGRGLLNNDGLHEFQTASITNTEEELNNYILEFIKKQNEINTTHAKSIPHLPNIVRYDNIKQAIQTLKNIPFGIEKHTLNIATIDLTSNIGNIISSNKLVNTINLSKSLLSILRIIPNNNLMIIDPTKELLLDNNYYPNYYTDNLEQVLDKINEYIENLVDKKEQTEGTIFIYSVNRLISKLEDKTKLENLIKNIKKYEKINITIVEEVKKLKEYIYESWYTSIFGHGNGLWVGKGVTDQSVLKTSAYNKEMQLPYKNNMGFYIIDGDAILVKYIDFITKDKDGPNE